MRTHGFAPRAVNGQVELTLRRIEAGWGVYCADHYRKPWDLETLALGLRSLQEQLRVARRQRNEALTILRRSRIIDTRRREKIMQSYELKKGLKFRPKPPRIGNRGCDTRFMDRTLEVMSAYQDDRGRVEVFSVNHTLCQGRRIWVSAKRLVSSAYKLVPLALLAFLVGCAPTLKLKPEAPPRQVVSCQNEPQWFVYDKAGKPSAAVFVCFADDGVLTYHVKPLSPEQIAALVAEKEKSKKPAPKKAAKP